MEFVDDSADPMAKENTYDEPLLPIIFDGVEDIIQQRIMMFLE